MCILSKFDTNLHISKPHILETCALKYTCLNIFNRNVLQVATPLLQKYLFLVLGRSAAYSFLLVQLITLSTCCIFNVVSERVGAQTIWANVKIVDLDFGSSSEGIVANPVCIWIHE